MPFSRHSRVYLAWAFFEAAHFAIQYLPAAKGFYERKAAQRNPILAMKALSHKLAPERAVLVLPLVAASMGG
jgi:hypothetical protein